jgi:type IV secretion system protein VirB3/type IV secretion system protein VirB4
MRTEPIHRSLHRRALFLGADRELVLFSCLIAFLTALGGFSLVSAGCGFLFWLVALFWLRTWATNDPLMRDVFIRHVRQQDYYPAKTSAWRRLQPAASPWRKK